MIEFIMYLKGSVTERKGKTEKGGGGNTDREGEIFQLLGHSTNGCYNGQDWARANQGARSRLWITPHGLGAPGLRPFSASLPAAL